MYCQLDFLSKFLPGRVQYALNELPETLDEIYGCTLREINGANWEFARRLLLYVATVSRPLRVEELVEFLAFDFNVGPIPKFHEDRRLEDPLEAVLSTCSTLLSLVNVGDSPVIQFSHFSVKEFLMSPPFAKKYDIISDCYHVSMTSAHTLFAQACLGILLHLDRHVTRDSLRRFPLATSEHWFDHVRVEGVSKNAKEGMKQLFDDSKPHLAIWLWIYDPTVFWEEDEQAERPAPPRGTLLHYAAFCGLHDFVKILTIERPQDVDSQSFSDEATPLHLASEEGHVDVARILVGHGADTTASLCTRTAPPGRAILRFWRPGTTLMSTYRPLRR